MNMIDRRFGQASGEGVDVLVNGGHLVCHPCGTLFAPEFGLLIVSDLHLEKGAAFARRGMMLPPYDTAATLALLAGTITRLNPRHVVALGDSFHDRHGAAHMPEPFRERLAALMAGRRWTWISGNHDPEPPAGLGGDTAETIELGPWTLRHEPSPHPCAGEIAGHLHPVARVSGRGRSVRGACFATDGERMIMPSFGVTTGGLNVLDRAFSGLFQPEQAKAYVIGTARIYPIPFRALSPG